MKSGAALETARRLSPGGLVGFAFVIAFAGALGGCSGSGASTQAAQHGSLPVTTEGNESASGSKAGSPNGVDADPGTATPELAAKRVAKSLKRVSQVRGIVSTRDVPSRVLERKDLIARIKRHVGTQVPAEAIAHEGATMKLLGVVPPSFDYAAVTFSMLEGQIAGFYEPEDGTMYLASDLSGDAADATLAHELVHALQDQKWSLGPKMAYQPGRSDASSAFHALAEGDATSAMLDVIISAVDKGKTALDVPDELLSQQSMMAGSTPMPNVPPILLSSLVAPYVEGTRFVHALRRQGGWPAVDQAWARPPTTTEQLLHVEKWEKQEAPLGVDPPPSTGLGPAYKGLDEDSTGELGLRLLFSAWVGEVEAERLARGWGGDRDNLVSDGKAHALAVRLRYDPPPPRTPKEARAQATFSRLARAWQKTGLGKVAADGASFFCVERPELGPLAVAYKERDVVLVAGPAVLDGTPAPAGTCADARRWVTATWSAPGSGSPK